MKREPSISFAAATASGLALTLAVASPGFAGVSNFSVDQTATLVQGTNNKQATVTGTVSCPNDKVLTIGIQIMQQGKMAALAKGEIRGLPCSAGNSWTVTVYSLVPMQGGLASVLAGAWACTPSESKATGPCSFAHSSGEITLQ